MIVQFWHLFKDKKTPTQKYICTYMFTATLFIMVKIWKQSICLSIDR